MAGSSVPDQKHEEDEKKVEELTALARANLRRMSHYANLFEVLGGFFVGGAIVLIFSGAVLNSILEVPKIRDIEGIKDLDQRNYAFLGAGAFCLVTGLALHWLKRQYEHGIDDPADSID